MDPFDRLADLPMKARAPRRTDLLVECAADERVTELVDDARVLLLLAKDLRRERLVEKIEQRVFLLIGDRDEEVPREPCADDRCAREQAVARLAEARETLADDLANPFRDRKLARPAGSRGATVLQDLLEHLLDEQR